MAKLNISSGSVKDDSLITLYANSPEARRLNPKYVNLLKGVVVTPNVQATANLSGSEFDGDTAQAVDAATEDDNSKTTETDQTTFTADAQKTIAPSLTEITKSSSTIVYDSTGKPSVVVVFKIKNSSGKPVKTVNARVSL